MNTASSGVIIDIDWNLTALRLRLGVGLDPLGELLLGVSWAFANGGMDNHLSED
jgi:hypothetical protein